MKSLFLVLVLFSSAINAQERHRVDDGILPNVVQATVQIYAKGIMELKEVYNQNTRKAYDPQFYKKLGLNEELSKFPKQLPIATIEDGKFQIKKIGFSYGLENYMEGSFNLKGKTYNLDCKQPQQCLSDFLGKYQPSKKTSFLSLFISSAYANQATLNLNRLLDDDFVILASLAALDESIETIPEAWSLPRLWTWEGTRVERRNNNIRAIYSAIRSQNRICQNRNQNRLENDNEEIDLLEQIAQYRNFQEVETQIQTILGEHVYSDTGFDAMFFINQRLADKEWKNYLTCDRLGKTKIVEHNEANKPEFCRDGLAGCRITNDSFVGDHQAYCNELESLKNCLKDYYSSMDNVSNREHIDEGRFRQIRGNLESSRAFEAD